VAIIARISFVVGASSIYELKQATRGSK